MEMWFIAALAGMTLAGISNFGFKIAAKNNFDAETFTFYGGLSSVFLAGVGLIVVRPDDLSVVTLLIISVLSGFISSQTNLFKVLALRYIDTTIFFPLFKITSPLLAVIFGIVFFAETFTTIEWIGIILGHLIPLLLINKVENGRQKHLFAGIMLMLLVSLLSAITAALNKYAIDQGFSEMTTLWYMSWGITVGCLSLLALKIKTLPFKHIKQHTSLPLVKSSVSRSAFICFSVLCILFAYGNGGDLGIVQTIQGFYIIIPIVLSVLIYKEHIDWKKVIAVGLCIVSLIFLG